MFKKLRIQNFKGWKDTDSIGLSPLTLFFGANSSGKSSIGQFLMMLKQTIESPDRKAVFNTGGNNSAVRLGSYEKMVFHRDPQNKIAFEYRWTLTDPLKFTDPLSDQSFAGNELAFSAEVGLSALGNKVPQVEKFNYRLLDNDKQSLSVDFSQKPDKNEYIASAEQYSLVKKKMRACAPKEVVRFYGFPDEMVACYQNAEFVQYLNLAHEKLFSSVSYLGPLRTRAERIYTWSGIAPESVGFAGENTIAAILAARDRTISLGYKKQAKPFEEIIAAKLKEMDLIEEFKVSAISSHRQDYEVRIRTRGSDDWVELPDVGFGVSQVLPVLVQCFYAPAGSVILMEQPELHLHPSAQSALADVMIDALKAKENGTDRNIQLIIESHSEHFLRRLQRRIAEDAISQEKVSVYFANNATTPATLEPLQIDRFGNIKNWPENFFGDEMGDIAGQAQAAMKKRMQQKEQQQEFSK